tara:strand:+ start:2018 stop:3535 length:1518 start_codon:yes stop_codon:yes gene_type:complete
MNWFQNTHRIATKIVSLLFIVLFVYAAASKLLDFENFRVQLGQSPMLSAYAGWIAWLLPIFELIIVLLLCFPKTQLWGFIGGFLLMIMFTTYIYIVLNFSSFIPCSCGGVLEQLSWTEHLVFNGVFILLAILGLYFSLKHTAEKRNPFRIKTIVGLLSLTIGGIGLVTILFISSENKMHQRNPFIRRFPHHPITFVAEKDLQMNSYYIAGLTEKNIYLGNHTAPLQLLILNTNLKEEKNIELSTTKTSLPYRSIKLEVAPPYFYLADGGIPYILKGKTNNWKAQFISAKGYFSLAVPMDSNTVAIRTRDSKTHEKILGILKLDGDSKIKLSRHILKKQIDGVFDTDGTLIYNKQLQKLIYTYFYRNSFMIIDSSLTEHKIGKTIDTVSKVQIKVTAVTSKNRTKMETPPLLVNKTTSTYGNYLFVHSNLMGLYEPKDTWKRSSVIDIYDLRNQTYVFSFYIPNRGKESVSEFKIENDLLVCMVGHFIKVYNFKTSLLDGSWKMEN